MESKNVLPERRCETPEKHVSLTALSLASERNRGNVTSPSHRGQTDAQRYGHLGRGLLSWLLGFGCLDPNEDRGIKHTLACAPHSLRHIATDAAIPVADRAKGWVRHTESLGCFGPTTCFLDEVLEVFARRHIHYPNRIVVYNTLWMGGTQVLSIRFGYSRYPKASRRL